MKPVIDLLIPTYNRIKFLRPNILRTLLQLKAAGLEELVVIHIKDNCSTDETETVIRDIIKSNESLVKIHYTRNVTNIGLENNVIAILKEAKADHVMFLGDDDFLADGYLGEVINLISNNKEISYIVPAYDELYSDGRVYARRRSDKVNDSYEPGIRAVLDLASYSHQLSGLVFQRAGTIDEYLRHSSCKNIYLFTSFACFNMLRGRSVFLRGFSTSVWCGNTKDWSYDESGLLSEIYKNYIPYFRGRALARVQISHTRKQIWRLRPSYKSPIKFLRSIQHLWKQDSPHWLTKMTLVFLPFVEFPTLISDCLKGDKRFIYKPNLLRDYGVE